MSVLTACDSAVMSDFDSIDNIEDQQTIVTIDFCLNFL